MIDYFGISIFTWMAIMVIAMYMGILPFGGHLGRELRRMGFGTVAIIVIPMIVIGQTDLFDSSGPVAPFGYEDEPVESEPVQQEAPIVEAPTYESTVLPNQSGTFDLDTLDDFDILSDDLLT